MLTTDEISQRDYVREWNCSGSSLVFTRTKQMLPSSQTYVITVYKLLGIMGVESGNFSSSSLKVRGLHGSLVINSF